VCVFDGVEDEHDGASHTANDQTAAVSGNQDDNSDDDAPEAIGLGSAKESAMAARTEESAMRKR